MDNKNVFLISSRETTTRRATVRTPVSFTIQFSLLLIQLILQWIGRVLELAASLKKYPSEFSEELKAASFMYQYIMPWQEFYHEESQTIQESFARRLVQVVNFMMEEMETWRRAELVILNSLGLPDSMNFDEVHNEHYNTINTVKQHPYPTFNKDHYIALKLILIELREALLGEIIEDWEWDQAVKEGEKAVVEELFNGEEGTACAPRKLTSNNCGVTYEEEAANGHDDSGWAV